MNKHIVVGGGIAGIATCFYLMNRGCSVLMLETAPSIGGLLASKRINNRYYDYGTHLLSKIGISEVDSYLFDGLEYDCFEYIKVGSFFGSLYEGNGFVHDFSFPPDNRRELMDAFLAHPRQAGSRPSNLREQLVGAYGALVYETLLEPPLKKYFRCNPQNLVVDSHKLFGLGRLMLGDQESCRNLKLDPTYDNLLGYHSYKEGGEANSSFYPREGGVGAWITLLESKLRKGGVEIETNAQFSLEVADGRVNRVFVGGQTHAVDQIYWTVPAAVFYSMAKIDKLEGPPPMRLSSLVVDLEIDGDYATDVYYVQNYDPSMQCFRITLYDNFNGHWSDIKRATVEFLVAEDQLTESSYHELALLEIKRMGLIEAKAASRVVGSRLIRGGFPIPTLDFVSSTRKYASGLEEIANLTLFGKATGRTWFMTDVIREIHQYFQAA